ncbi:humulene synthase [Penicillium samsonianum]|uniref:humulene synthase n=1 Tax=Penicillium samsonianum TaxID=1882272 RepID=UPI002548B663|nr:humulene synthase [Penicillium samsonianum]KAJ6133186.1 humulene synthase [Penicillium samsonianum]
MQCNAQRLNMMLHGLEKDKIVHFAICFHTISDNAETPQQDIFNGPFRLCGNSYSDLLAGLRLENFDEDDVTTSRRSSGLHTNLANAESQKHE